VRVDADLVEALVAAGRLEEARDVLAAFGERMATARLPWSTVAHARATALTRLAVDDLEGAVAALDDVAVQAARLPLLVERARLDLVEGVALRRLRRVREARTALERACAGFDAAPVPPLAAQARRELARLGGRQASGHELTAAETQVAVLAAAGRTNREIAGELVVSVRTVESQLSSAYAKLGIRGRASLAAALTAQREAEA
jgi:DNA-binding CsgD family transcriptional regulator